MGVLKLLIICIASLAMVKGKHSVQLYNAVVSKAMDEALDITKTLNHTNTAMIRETIEQLSMDEVDNILLYAYKLWISGQKDVVINTFPEEVKLLLNEDDVKIISSKFNIPLKLDMHTDGDGDRALWGDGLGVDEYRHRFRFEPILMGDKIMFKIKNVQHAMYLKLDSHQDEIGDRAVFGDAGHAGDDRLTFVLETFQNQNGFQFFIVNQQYKQCLKLALSTDDDNDRRAWGHKGQYREDKLHFGFKIKKILPSVSSTIFTKINKEQAEVQDLYNYVADGLYEQALEITEKMMKHNQKHITTAVQSLLKDGVRNVMNYAYQLWNSDKTEVIRNCFPKTIEAILSGKLVQIFNVEYRLPLKQDVNTDSYGDRKVWGDATTAEVNRLLWSFTPVWEHNRVFFKINYIHRNNFMKLDHATDSDGDRVAYGNALNVPEYRLYFALEPELSDEQLSFYIINQEFGQALKMAVNTDSYKDRLVYGHHGLPYGNDRRRWTITVAK